MGSKSSGRRAKQVETTELQQTILERLSKSQKVSHAHVTRARIILEAKKGKRNTAIAKEMSCTRETVQRWRARWVEAHNVLAEREKDVTEGGYQKMIEATLSDKERPGCPATFTAEQLCQIVAVAVQAPEEYGCPVTHWTPNELRQVVIKEGIVDTISTRHIGRFLKGVRLETASVAVLVKQ